MKRFLEFIYSFIIIIIFLPIGIPIILILKFSGEGEIFYIQERVGQEEKLFGLYKFVTMIKNSPNLGAGDITLKNDPRVLPFGKLLRKLKLNEFPQFLNVLFGNMALVGPRPLVKNQFMMYSKNDRMIIKTVKPGITGIGSIIFRDEEKFLDESKEESNTLYQNEIIPFKAKLEIWYCQNRNIFIDHIIIIITILNVLLPNISIHNYLLKDLPRHKLFNK